VVSARITLHVRICGAILLEVVHERGVIARSLGIEDSQALVVKCLLRDLALCCTLTYGVGNSNHNGGAPEVCVSGHWILLERESLPVLGAREWKDNEQSPPHCRTSSVEGLNESPYAASSQNPQ
jgi:hypothetical protein